MLSKLPNNVLYQDLVNDPKTVLVSALEVLSRALQESSDSETFWLHFLELYSHVADAESVRLAFQNATALLPSSFKLLITYLRWEKTAVNVEKTLFALRETIELVSMGAFKRRRSFGLLQMRPGSLIKKALVSVFASDLDIKSGMINDVATWLLRW